MSKHGADAASTSAQEIAGHFLASYKKTTSKTVQLIDYFLVFALVTGIVQFAYVLLVGQFPFNSFLAGFVAAVGFFVFTGQ
jgi:oligosaccharyltransferase complex subunit epsilon